jgi:hypothetical protein
MLPKQIDKALRSLGDDGDQVRGLIEREFASYLEKSRPEREARDLKGTIAEIGGNLLRPASTQAGKRLAKELFSPESGGFAQATARINARREARKSELVTESGAGTATPAFAETRRGRGRNVLRPR